MVEERTGEAFELGEHLTVVGHKLQPGQPAPDFALDQFDPASGEMRTVRLADSAGQVRLLTVVNSVDTPVCHVETRHWEAARAELPAGVQLVHDQHGPPVRAGPLGSGRGGEPRAPAIASSRCRQLSVWFVPLRHGSVEADRA